MLIAPIQFARQSNQDRTMLASTSAEDLLVNQTFWKQEIFNFLCVLKIKYWAEIELLWNC